MIGRWEKQEIRFPENRKKKKERDIIYMLMLSKILQYIKPRIYLFDSPKKILEKSQAVVANTFNPCTREAEAGGSL